MQEKKQPKSPFKIFKEQYLIEKEVVARMIKTEERRKNSYYYFQFNMNHLITPFLVFILFFICFLFPNKPSKLKKKSL